MSQVEATILGQSYKLACNPGRETLLREAVAVVDREMSAIRDAGKVKARERMAVLAALNLAYQLADPVARPIETATDSATDAVLERLVRRVDEALGDDGHLL